jgi:NTE family protein
VIIASASVSMVARRRQRASRLASLSGASQTPVMPARLRDPDERSASRHRGRIGLVLGAGGPVGHAFHAGTLRALEHALGWDARSSDLVVGTSAGAQVAALLRAGMHGADLAARVTGEPLRPAAREIAQHYVRPSHDVRPAHDVRPSHTDRASDDVRPADDGRPPRDAAGRDRARPYSPASPMLVARSLRTPTLLRPGRLIAALLPEGRVRLDPLAEGLRNLFGETWPAAPMWITSVQLDTGEPVAFGREGAPSIDVGTAVACSAAVPGVFTPVAHAGLRYVDGAVASATHLDLLATSKLDLVIVCSPLSVFPPMRALLAREIRALERAGTPVVALEPSGAAAAAMGYRPMALDRAAPVARAAYETTLRAIEVGVARERFRDAF